MMNRKDMVYIIMQTAVFIKVNLKRVNIMEKVFHNRVMVTLMMEISLTINTRDMVYIILLAELCTRVNSKMGK